MIWGFDLIHFCKWFLIWTCDLICDLPITAQCTLCDEFQSLSWSRILTLNWMYKHYRKRHPLISFVWYSHNGPLSQILSLILKQFPCSIKSAIDSSTEVASITLMTVKDAYRMCVDIAPVTSHKRQCLSLAVSVNQYQWLRVATSTDRSPYHTALPLVSRALNWKTALKCVNR